MPTLRDHLEARRAQILDRWRERILSSYPEDAAQQLLRQRDPFANPVGHAVTESIGLLFDGILASSPSEELRGALDGLVRVRAVQSFTASQAVSFVFLLKGIIRDEVAGPEGETEWAPEAIDLENRIDDLVLEAFDIYVGCRERLYELRANEVKRSAHQLLKRARTLEEEARTKSHHVKGAL